MNRYKVEITEPAEKDLYEIWRYIAKELLEPDIARKVVNKIGEAILKLEEMPLRNALVADERLAFQGIRKMTIDNYLVFYIVAEESKTVTIVRILYGRRDWINLL
ncbi:MAG: toxin ParE1/3/4 [Thermoanaerobacterium sp.]|jgi:addiction module RelE/StbE family toxin|nr:toxin ParE1/3/4 [Thermoanaerobacterium sp.]MDN5302900.1 toxin ParE1/3/4 [Thermoanaerobacteraceae bacterium]